MEEIRFSRVLLLSAVGKRAFARIVALVPRLFRICAVRGSDGFLELIPDFTPDVEGSPYLEVMESPMP